MIEFNYKQKITLKSMDEFPMLGWLMHVSNENKPELYYGAAVEITADGFSAGLILDNESQPENIEHMFGSAMYVLNADEYLFLPASHAFECLYFIKNDSGCCVSNSLASIVGFYNCEITLKQSYARDFASNCNGIDDYKTEIVHTSAGVISRFIYDNLKINKQGQHQFVRKPKSRAINDYASYVDLLKSNIKKSIELAQNKPIKYQSLCTCSAGYDSSSTAALVSQVDDVEAITMADSRYGENDSGVEICDYLNIPVQSFKMPELEGCQLDDLAPFLATGMGGEDYYFKAFGSKLKNRLLFSGFYGDNLWSPFGAPHDVFLRKELSGSSLQEFNLWNNLINIPVPSFYGRNHEDIWGITHSSELQAFRVDNDYDRPIPRRILEQAGVPRTSFGQKKMAASLLIFRDHGLIGKTAIKQIEAMLPASWIARVKYGMPVLIWRTRFYLHKRLEHLKRYRLPALGRLQKLITGNIDIFVHSNPHSSLHFVAGLKYMASVYVKIYAKQNNKT